MTEPKLKATRAQAKAAWEAHANPSLNNVLAALHAAGFTGMVKSTLQRWHASEWAESKKRGPPAPPPATAADAATAKQATKQADDDEAAAEIKGVIDAETERKTLAETALSVLAETAARESLVAQIMLARQVQNRAEQLIKFYPKEAAKLIEALKKDPASNVTVVIPPKPGEHEPMRTVGGNVIEHDDSDRPLTPLQQSIREFRGQPLKVVR